MKIKKYLSILLAGTLMTASFYSCERKDESATPSALQSDKHASDPVPALANRFDDLSTKKQGWGQGVQCDEQNRPISCLSFQEKYGKYNALFIKEDAPQQLFLTFDEGYENGYTSQILDVLKDKSIHAVFFVTYDYVAKNQDLIRRMISEGHIIGNHTMSHPSMPTLSPEKMESEIMNLDRYMEEHFQYKMTLFRPPMGEFSQQSLAVTQSLGYTTVFWSFAYSDWNPKRQPDPASALQKQLDRLHSGAIYLLHAVSKTNANVLGDFITQAQEKGYTFSSLA